tara:strand:+ start:40870 stop:41019 length:150 start_codon:yes stop_codon:yes gene_type:complete
MTKKTGKDQVIDKVLKILTRLGVDSESEEGFELIERVREELLNMGDGNG